MIAITGSTGQLGTAFRRLLPEAAHLTRRHLDLGDPGSVGEALAGHRPELVINCAAYTAVDRAEDEEEAATVVNGEAVGAMAEWCASHHSKLVTFSTDYVFDGSGNRPYLESDPTDPINAYGRSKRLGEELVLAAHPDALVVRTSWVISGTHPNFVATMLRLAPERVLTVVDDQRGCPTVAADLAAATLRALEVGASGLLHLTNQGPTTWLGLARAALELAGIDPERVQPCATADYPTKARRPAYSVLGSERLEVLGIEPLPPWKATLPHLVGGVIRSN
ncbi:MAG: dTDP-4-dehydrorhamnose reductase [Acidimicrobiia bacterium]